MQISLKSNLSLIWAIGLVFLLSSCYENKEGCLDLASSNYDPTADVACEDCCTYPKASIGVTHRVEAADMPVSFSKGDTLTNDLEEQIAILNAKFYTHGYSFTGSSTTTRVEDELSFVDAMGEQQSIEDDITMISATTFKYDIGTIMNYGDYTSLKFSLGVPEVLESASSITLPSDNPLAFAGDSLIVDNQYMHAWVVLQQVGYHNEDNFSDTVKLTLPYTYDISIDINQLQGQSITGTCLLYYKELIKGLDYKTMSASQIKSQLEANLPNIFTSF